MATSIPFHTETSEGVIPLRQATGATTATHCPAIITMQDAIGKNALAVTANCSVVNACLQT